ncbi:FtsX-like permease family protein [Actinoplanes sp. CA-142083]|uniref:ABC transporter permease n=1 Tax=Actinoplanes sp. CA-142083 TaxID=3239903 RepID=UPI003D8C08AA
MMRLALGTLRRHRGAYAGTLIAAMLAVALLAGGGLLLYSVLTAKPPADRFAAATLVVPGAREVSVTTETTKHKKEGKAKVKRKTKTERLTGAGTLPTDLAGRIAALPGVTRVVPDAAFPVQVTGASGRPLRGADKAPVIGHGWASAVLTPYGMKDGQPPTQGEVVIDADLAARGRVAIGDILKVTSRTGERSLRVSGIAAPPGRDGLPAQGALFVADREVAAVSGLDGPTALGVFGTPKTGLDGLTGDDKVRADLPGALPDYIGPISIFGFVIGITAFAAVFVLTGTVTLSVRQRLRELALLRTAGATPRQLRRLLGLESVVLAALAALPALPLGIVSARLVAARFQTLGVVPAQFAVRVNVPVLLLAALAGLLVTFVAARIAARRAVRIAPTQALAETAAAPAGTLFPRLLLALVTAGGAAAVLTFVPLGGPLGMGMSFVSSALLLCAVAAVGPWLVRPLTLLARPLGLAGLLARTEFRRVAAVAVPLVLMFGINAPMLLNSTLLSRLASQQQAERNASATEVVASRVPLTTARRIAGTPGVTGMAALLPTRVIAVRGGKPEDYPAQGLLATGSGALDLDIRAGAYTADGVGASEALARQFGWRVGNIVPLWLADGTRVELPLTMVYARDRGFGDVVLPAALVAAHDPSGLVSTINVRKQGAEAHAPAAWAAEDAPEQQGAWELLVVISLGFTAIAVVNTSAIAAAGRRREYADLRLAGATAGQLHRLAGAEALVTVLAGLVLGAAVTGVVVGAFSTAQDGTLRWIVDPATYATMAGGVAALGLIAGVLPTRLLVRRRTPASAV